MRVFQTLKEHYWLATVAECEDAAAKAKEESDPETRSKTLAKTVLLGIACLMVVRFLGNENDIEWATGLLRTLGLNDASSWLTSAFHAKSPDVRLAKRVWWAAFRIIGYGLLPLALGRWASGVSIREMGLSGGNLKSHAKVYALLFAIMMPAIFVASFSAGFQAKYPYYKVLEGEALWPRFVLWELLYAINFAALEFYFRGYLVHGLKRSLGYGAIFSMMIPYAMIHFGKPLPEALGSILTGFVLGTLSIKHRSIWGGVFLHVSAACSMDVWSLWHRGLL